MKKIKASEDRSRGVCYFNHGTKHAARLVASVWSLRMIAKHAGPVTLFDTGASGGVVEKIASDGRLGLDLQRVPFEQLRRNSCYVAKAGLWRYSPYMTSVLLDADTLPVRPIDRLFEAAEEDGRGCIVVTQFSNWVTTGDIIRGRIERWRDVVIPSDDRAMLRGINAAQLVDASFREPLPAINTGVVAWASEALGVLRDWDRLTRAGWKNPFTDELALQLLLRKFNHHVVGDEWNCSPIYGTPGGRAKVKIWHAHGAKHLSRSDGRGDKGHAIWWPAFVEVWRSNAGRIREWAPGDDEALAAYVDELNEATGRTLATTNANEQPHAGS